MYLGLGYGFPGSSCEGPPARRMIKRVLIMILFAWLPTLMIPAYVPAAALRLPNLLLG